MAIADRRRGGFQSARFRGYELLLGILLRALQLWVMSPPCLQVPTSSLLLRVPPPGVQMPVRSQEYHTFLKIFIHVFNLRQSHRSESTPSNLLFSSPGLSNTKSDACSLEIVGNLLVSFPCSRGRWPSLISRNLWLWLVGPVQRAHTNALADHLKTKIKPPATSSRRKNTSYGLEKSVFPGFAKLCNS